jgi:hypothetical protein
MVDPTKRTQQSEVHKHKNQTPEAATVEADDEPMNYLLDRIKALFGEVLPAA